MNHLKGNCSGSSGVRRNKEVKGGKRHVTSAVLSCTSPVGLTSVKDAQRNQTGSANSSTAHTAFAFPSCSAASTHKARVPSLAQKCNCLCIITRKPVWPKVCFCTALGRMLLVLWLASHCGPHSICSSCTGAAPRSLSVVLSSVLYHPADYQRIKPLDTHRYADNLANESLRLQFAWTLELAQSQV